MNCSNRILLLTSVLSLIAPCAIHADGLPTDTEIKTILRERIDSDHKGIGIVAGVLDEKGSRIIAYGKTARKQGRDVDGDTVFEIGSITKVFTCLVLADMVKHGEVSLDDPIAKYLPPTVKVPTRNDAQIKLVDLATQTSALPRLPDNMAPADGNNPYADYSAAQMYEFLSGYKLTRDIGTKYEYSNYGMGLLGHVLSLKAGMDYEALVEKRICQPLGMTSTRVTLTQELRARLARGHNAMCAPVANWDFLALAGCGALRSSANDLLKFAAANLGATKTDLQPAIELEQTPRHRAGSATMQIGLAWHIASRFGTEIVWHNGGTGGYRSFLGLDKKNRRAVVLLANSANEVDDIGFHLLEPKYELQKFDGGENHVAVEVAVKIMDGYTGRYQFESGTFFDVRRSEDHLEGKMTGQSFLGIYPMSQTEFFNDTVAARITFHNAADGKPAFMVLHQGGVDQTAEKISNDIPKDKERAAAHVDPNLYDTYAGRYTLAPGAEFTIKRQGNRLMAQLTGQAFYEVFPESETKFFYKVVDAQLTFEKNSKGEIAALTLHQNGIDQKAKKVK